MGKCFGTHRNIILGTRIGKKGTGRAGRVHKRGTERKRETKREESAERLSHKCVIKLIKI